MVHIYSLYIFSTSRGTLSCFFLIDTVIVFPARNLQKSSSNQLHIALYIKSKFS